MRRVRLAASAGAALGPLLEPQGVEFPCGGEGICRGCRVRVVEGEVPVTSEMEALFSGAELAAGWRLACRGVARGPVVVEVAQWESPVLTDEAPVRFTPREGVGVAVDVGTTTLVAQSVDLATGAVLGVETALNPQAPYGADVMSRIAAAMAGAPLRRLIREAVEGMVERLCMRPQRVVLVGNTVMHHLWGGLNVAPLAEAPFEARELGSILEGKWEFLPCIGGFVGSDILAGISACGMAESDRLTALIDLGTNGEIVLGSRERLVCASTAAGPAFEAAQIRHGMRAAPGAIAHVAARDGRAECRVIGDVPPLGICGSGLVEAVAAGLDLGWIAASGRSKGVPLTGDLGLTQRDIRELQLAKAAIASGLRLLAEVRGVTLDEIETVYLAGAFGNYVSPEAALRVGLVEVPRITAAGNTALRGAKLHLLNEAPEPLVEHFALASHERFQDTFAECIGFVDPNAS
ncbi:MAG: ASKHA domain-containing protein [Bryobacteraceae bacterium]|nr:ASKHA domain-containing protein [Bryobacteraceae bacterium]